VAILGVLVAPVTSWRSAAGASSATVRCQNNAYRSGWPSTGKRKLCSAVPGPEQINEPEVAWAAARAQRPQYPTLSLRGPPAVPLESRATGGGNTEAAFPAREPGLLVEPAPTAADDG